MGNCGSQENFPEIVLNYDDPQPNNESEREILESVQSKLGKGSNLLEVIEGYVGCDELIRNALSNPQDKKVEEKAWKSVKKSVAKLLKFYNYSQHIDELWPQLLKYLSENSEEVITNQQALLKEISQLFHFIFLFDLKKMMNPHIQNDFAYYRRVLSRMKNSKEKKKLSVNDELANKMSFFFAYPTPMMKVLIDATTKIFNKDEEKENLISSLSLLANVSLKAVLDALENPSHKEDVDNGNDHHVLLYLCTITGCVILVDHLDQRGVFHSKSTIFIKRAVETITDYRDITNTDFLLNSLRFTTLHLNDETTISAVKRLLVT
jgi:hypothetical protein